MAAPESPAPPEAPRGARWRAAVLPAAWLILPALLWAADYARGRHNTFKIYRQVFWHLVARADLYARYPEQYADVNLYGPVFGLVVAPFALLPEVLGGLLWNVSMAAILWVALRRLRLLAGLPWPVLLLVTLELLNACWANQFNPAIAALPLLTLADVEEGRDLRAPLWALLGAFVKVYGALGLVCVLFAKDRRAFLLGCVAWGAVLLAAPMALSSPGFVLEAYQGWYGALAHKSAANIQLVTAQDISLMGLVRRAAGVCIPGAWFYLAAFPLALAPLARRSQWGQPPYQRLVVASFLMFVVLFSSGSENATYVVAAAGVALWLLDRPTPPGRRELLLVGAMILAALAPTDLLSREVRRVANAHALKALPYAIAWLLVCRDLLTWDFGVPRHGTGAAGPADPSSVEPSPG
jgi:hypothetical protein